MAGRARRRGARGRQLLVRAVAAVHHPRGGRAAAGDHGDGDGDRRTADQPTTGPATPTETSGGSAPSGPVDLLRGRFVSHEHGTSGRVRVVSQPDGSRLLAIEDLDTSDGPDLRVWLTDAEVSEDGWRVFDDGRYVDLGELRGNKGNLVYELPREVDLADYQSVSIWCERFSVSFGAAALVPA